MLPPTKRSLPQIVWLVGVVFLMLLHLRQRRIDHTLAVQLRTGTPTDLRLVATPQVSILVAAWNEAALIDQHITSFRRLRYPAKEIIICAGGADNTFEVARAQAAQDIIILPQAPGTGKQRALQQCLHLATGDIIVLADADSIFSDDAFEQLIAPIVSSCSTAVSGMTRPLPAQIGQPFVIYQWFSEHYAAARMGNYTHLLRGCNAAIDYETLRLVGAFDAEAPIGTDEQLSAQLRRAGVPITLVRASMIANEYPASLSAYTRQQSRWLRVALLRALKVHDMRLIQITYNLLLSLAPLCLIVATPWLGRGALGGAALLVGHMLLARYRIIMFGRKLLDHAFPWRGYLNLPLYIIVDIGVRLVCIVDFMRKNARKQWY
jgi:cellulose synthase/poly-beta-1,6-N-acetylglucosamine synthase-like glycosyltransferase